MSRNSNTKYIVEHYCNPLDMIIKSISVEVHREQCQEIAIKNTYLSTKPLDTLIKSMPKSKSLPLVFAHWLFERLALVALHKRATVSDSLTYCNSLKLTKSKQFAQKIKERSPNPGSPRDSAKKE